jgi:phosphoserine aminotransferase
VTARPPAHIDIPPGLLPADGRFGCGPSKVPASAVQALAEVGSSFLGTSHRQPPVKNVVARIRAGLHDLFSLPPGWEVVLGNGGTTAFWDVATFGLIEWKSQHCSFGEFSAKFAAATDAAPHLAPPDVISAPAGSHPKPAADPAIDLYALTHNETSTGVMMRLERPVGADGLIVVDATSGAGGLPWDPTQVDTYYFAPQKCFASEGGLWIALCSPSAVERIERINSSGRWIPASLDLKIALENSRLDQTNNTPALATLFLLDQQLQWMLGLGGLDACVARSEQSAATLYGWAEKSPFAVPFVADEVMRSTVVGTIDLEGVDAATVSAVLREYGIVDTESYRKLRRNQLRIGLFPSIDPADVEALTACIDHVVTALS